MNHQATLERIANWANDDDNVRAVVLTGSAARGADAMDDLSDLDLELYVDRPAELLDDSAWYQAFGDVLVVEALENPGWHPTRLVYYVDGKVDFLIAPKAAIADAKYVRPFRVLVDKDGIAIGLSVTLRSRPRLPNSDDFNECVNWFYAAALMCAKCAVRGELWMAKIRSVDMNTQLLRMIEWDHRARHGADYDTWHKGVHMHDWADPEIQAAVTRCWGRFDAGDTTEALVHGLSLFSELQARTSKALGFAPFGSERVKAEVRRILKQIDGRQS